MNDNSSYWDIIITTVTAATTTATVLLLLLLLLLLLVGQEDEGIWEQGLMISNVLLEMTEPVSHKGYQKYKHIIVYNSNSTAISKYVTLKMTDVPSKHVWKIKESCYVYTTIYIVAAI